MGAKTNSKKRSKKNFRESQKRKSHMRGKNKINLNHDNEIDEKFNEEINLLNESGPSTSEQKPVELPLTVLELDDRSLHTSRLLRKRKEPEAPSTSELKVPPQSKVKPSKIKKVKKNEEKLPNIEVSSQHEERASRAFLSINPEPIMGIKVEQDFACEDPLNQSDFMIEIKEEPLENSDFVSPRAEKVTVEVPPVVPTVPSTSKTTVLVPSVIGSAPSNYSSNYPLGTVVMDDIQIFANRLAEQLRSFPPQKALLLQLDIQYMIDNEKQLLSNEQS